MVATSSGKRLTEAAKELRVRLVEHGLKYGEQCQISHAELLEAIRDIERQVANDSEPITPEWCSSQWIESSPFRDVKVFELFDSISIVFKACVGGWSKPELHVGKSYIRYINSRGEVRRLFAALKGGE